MSVEAWIDLAILTWLIFDGVDHRLKERRRRARIMSLARGQKRDATR